MLIQGWVQGRLNDCKVLRSCSWKVTLSNDPPAAMLGSECEVFLLKCHLLLVFFPQAGHWELRTSNSTLVSIIKSYLFRCSFPLVVELCMQHIQWESDVCIYFEPFWPWLKLAKMSTIGRTGNCLTSFPLMDDHFHCRMLNFRMFRNCFISNNCFSITIAHVFLSWHCLNTCLNSREQETAFIEVFAPSDNQFVEGWWLAAPGYNLP